MFRLRKTARVDGEVVTGTDRGVVDLAMRDGVILPLPREAVVDGQEAREVAAVEGQAPAQEEVVRVSDRAKPRCNGQAAVLALKSTSIVVKSVTGPPTLGPQIIWTRRYTKTKYYQKTCGNLSNKWKFGVQI